MNAVLLSTSLTLVFSFIIFPAKGYSSNPEDADLAKIKNLKVEILNLQQDVAILETRISESNALLKEERSGFTSLSLALFALFLTLVGLGSFKVYSFNRQIAKEKKIVLCEINQKFKGFKKSFRRRRKRAKMKVQNRVPQIDEIEEKAFENQKNIAEYAQDAKMYCAKMLKILHQIEELKKRLIEKMEDDKNSRPII